ncbi:MAG: hypothetical protein WBA93_23975 [Microcoleaceae cyanobacterium]
MVAEIGKQNQWDEMIAIGAAFSKYKSLCHLIMECVQQATLTRIPLSSEEMLQEYAQQM